MKTNVLHEDEWVTLTLDATVGLVRYDRSALAYVNAGDLERSYAAVGQALGRVPPGLKLLIDIRRAPPRNDAMFEAKANGALAQLLKRFERNATLVRTAVGKLQTVRLASERGATAHVFDDEQQALAYLMAGD